MSGNSLGSQKKHEFWAPKTKVRKLAGLSNNLYKSFVHQKQMSGLSKKKMSLGHQKQMSGNPLGSQKSMSLGVPKQMSGNLLGSPELCILGIQEIRWAFKKHEFWAPLKKQSFSTKKQISGNPPGSSYMKCGHQNKCQETFWALKKTWVLDTNNKCQETRCDQKHVFWAPKQMSGNSPGSQTTCTRVLWALKNMSFGHQKQRWGNSPGSQKAWVLEPKNKCQENRRAL